MELLCEYLPNPVGIDEPAPRFTWIVDAEDECETGCQVGWRLRVMEHGSEEPERTVWDSGFVHGSETVNVRYGGEPLRSGRQYDWCVEIMTDQGRTIRSGDACFFTGIMDPDEWIPVWIGGPQLEQDTFWFRSGFRAEKEIKRAVAYVASPNYYVLTVNGKKATDTVLNNAWTDCNKTLVYGTWPITELVGKGDNAVGIVIGNGWNALEMGYQGYGLGEHLFAMQIELEYEDGSVRIIRTDPEAWQYSVDGPITMNSIYNGEDYDAGKELTGWDLPGYCTQRSGVRWFDAVEFEPMRGKLRSMAMEPIRIVEEREPLQVFPLPDGSYVFDMGQNFAGWARLTVEEAAGTQVELSYAELVNEDHSLNRVSLRGARAIDRYICSGRGKEVYEPSFTYHGFRYVQVKGLSEPPRHGTVIGCVVRSSVKKTGMFECSDELINQLQRNIQWTEASNLHGIPTDCPQRDERLGWLNDMTVRNECALYSYRLPRLYEKWLQDIRDAQGEVTGAITDTAPFRRFGQRPADPVCSSFLLIPWNLYCHYQDLDVIKTNYGAMKRWVEYLLKNAKGYIQKYAPFGDWAAPIGGTNLSSIGGGAVSAITPPQLMATGYLYYDCLLMEKMAALLGKGADEAYYGEQKEKVKDAFQKMYYEEAEGFYGTNSQACNTFPLYLGIVPAEEKERVLGHLERDIVEEHHTHLTTGNLCSRYMIEVLLCEGREDLAYQLLTQKTYPGWGYMIENGATTVWERWEKVTEEDSTLSKMASCNHPMNGAVGVAFYKYLAGIRVDEQRPGFQNIMIKPILPGELKSARAEMHTIRGRIDSSWEKTDSCLKMDVRIPFNCTADIFVPVEAAAHGGEQHLQIIHNGKATLDDGMMPEGGYIHVQVGAGKHHFEVLR